MPVFDLEQLLVTFGYVGLFAIIFAESGLLFGFFLPGDSLLITAGVLSVDPPGILSLPVVIVGCFIAAVTGDAVGYWTGARFGRRLYERPDSRLFKKSHLVAAQAFYDKHGGKTIVIARFLPFVRTFAPVVAGIADMQYRRFAVYNFMGAALWAIGLPIAGYVLGSIIPPETLDKYLLVILGCVVVLSVLPTAIHVVRANRAEISARIRSRGRVGAAPAGTSDERAEPSGPTA